MEETHMLPLLPDEAFRFSCTERVRCFNACCRDLNQFLTPYDIVRIKNRLGIPSDKFLAQYTLRHTGPGTGLPVVTFKTSHMSDLKCPFVTPQGCCIYEDRPSSCRMYPLARTLSRSRESKKITEQYFLLKEPHCLGFQEEKTRTVAEWIEDQGIQIYNEMNDMLMEIIALKNQVSPGMLDIRSAHLFYMACYDLDTFRIHVSEKNILRTDTDVWQMDDTALLKLGLAWIKQVLFGTEHL